MKDRILAGKIGILAPTRLLRCRALSSLAATRGAGASPGFGCFGLLGGLPFPRQQRIELMPFGPSGYDALQHIGKPGQRINAVQLRGLCRPPNYTERARFRQKLP